jgi:hypothetical protein
MRPICPSGTIVTQIVKSAISTGPAGAHDVHDDHDDRADEKQQSQLTSQ